MRYAIMMITYTNQAVVRYSRGKTGQRRDPTHDATTALKRLQQSGIQ